MILSNKLTRRVFLTSTATVASAAALVGCSKNDDDENYVLDNSNNIIVPDTKEEIFAGAAPHNCKGRCVTNAHVKNGVIKRMSTDERPDDPKNPQLRSCLRCRSYRTRLYNPGRLLYPLIYAPDEPDAERGDMSKFKRVTWEEAANYIKEKYEAAKAKTPDMITLNGYATGMSGSYQNKNFFYKVVNEKMGGSKGTWGGPSFNAGSYILPIITGQSYGNLYFTPENLLHAKTIFLWGSNVVHSTGATGYQWWLTQAREKGARVIYIGPVYNKTAEMAHEFIPIKPGTDTALLLAMMHVMIQENLLDTDFINKFCVGFYDDLTGTKDLTGKSSTAIPAGKSLSAYVMGGTKTVPGNSAPCSYTMDASSAKYTFKNDFLTEKSPEWAAPICGIPAEKIKELARIYADTGRPCAIRSSIGMQRQPNGVQNCWLLSIMAVITKNWGVDGTGVNYHYFSNSSTAISSILANTPSAGANPEGTSTLAAEAVWADIIRARGNPSVNAKWKFDADISNLTRPVKMIINYGGDSMVNQHQDTFATIELLKDRSNVELIITVDHLMTPSARWSDVVLPGDAHYEREEMIAYQNYILYMAKAIEPMGEIKSNDEIGYIIGHAFGMEKWEVNTDGRSYAKRMADTWKDTTSHTFTMTLDEFKKIGVYTNKSVGVEQGSSALRSVGSISDNNKLSTATGYFEACSNAVVSNYENRTITGMPAHHSNVDSDGDKEVLPIPFWVDYHSSYVDLYSGIYDQANPIDINDYPYMVLGNHSLWRVHSLHSTLGYLREIYKKDAQGNPVYDHFNYNDADWKKIGSDGIFQSAYGGKGYEPIWMNPEDVTAQGLRNGQLVKVTSAQTRRPVIAAVYETPRCMPGVFVLEQGSWFDPVELKDGTMVDRGGCSSTLISEMPTRNDRGPGMMLCRIKVEPFDESQYK